MTPDEIITQITWSYGELSAKNSTLFTWLKEVAHETEQALQPEYTLDESSVAVSGATSYSVSGAITVVSVADISGSRTLHRLDRSSFDSLWSDTPTCLYWFSQQQPDSITISFNQAPTDNVTIKAKYYTTFTSSSTDYPELDIIYPMVLIGMHAKASLVLKDIERFQRIEGEYRSLLGQVKQQPQKPTG